LESSARRVFASAIREDMLVDDGIRRASFRRRRTEKAHLAVGKISTEQVSQKDVMKWKIAHPKRSPSHIEAWQDTTKGSR